MTEVTNATNSIDQVATTAASLVALDVAAEEFATAHAGGWQNRLALRRTAEAYETAFQEALVGHADREIILAYAQDATRYATFAKYCHAATVSHVAPFKLGQARAVFTAWRASEQRFVAAGYRAVDFQRLYDSVAYPGVSKNVQLLIYKDFFACAGEFEEPVYHAEAELRKHPSLANPTDLEYAEKVVAWTGSRWVVGHYKGTAAGEFIVCAGDAESMTCHLVRYEDAVKTGVWPFKSDMAVVALVDNDWQEATWVNYMGTNHLVCVDGLVRTSDRVHLHSDAIAMGLLK
jgi:hypothetical protein